MKFRYAYQKIVELKENEKSQAEWIFASAVGELRREQSHLDSLHAEKRQLQDDMLQSAAGRTKAADLMLMQTYLMHIDEKIKHKREDVRRAEQNVESKQQVLSAKMAEEKIWTKAKEKAKQQFAAALLKKEQHEADEIATNRFIHGLP